MGFTPYGETFLYIIFVWLPLLKKKTISVPTTPHLIGTQRHTFPSQVGARGRDVSPDIHYSIFSDSHSPNLRAATRWCTCSRTRYMNENLSSSLRLYSTLKNSGKSSVVVWKNLPTGTQTYPQVLRLTLG